MMVDRTPYRPLEEGSQRRRCHRGINGGMLAEFEGELNLEKNFLVPIKIMVKGLVPYLRGLEARVFSVLPTPSSMLPGQPLVTEQSG